MDQFAVIWSQQTGRPKKLANMVLTPTDLRISRVSSKSTSAGFSMLHDIANVFDWVWPRSEDQNIPFQLSSLLPPAQSDIYFCMRSAFTEQLQCAREMPSMCEEWQMLMNFGAGGTGHLDVFACDEAAQNYYQRQGARSLELQTAMKVLIELQSDKKTQQNGQQLGRVLSNHQSASTIGMCPKLFATRELTQQSVLVKAEPTNYPCLLALESLALEYHRKAGCDVPNWEYFPRDFMGEAPPMLVIDRFDRESDGTPIPQETFLTLLNTGNRTCYQERTDGSMEKIIEVVSLPGLVGDPYQIKIDIFQRLILALATGNSDLHLENLALIGTAGHAKLAPVYDPAPMAAYQSAHLNHDFLSALPFAGVGGITKRPMQHRNECCIPDNLRAYCLQFSKTAGIKLKIANDIITSCLEVTDRFVDDACDVLSTEAGAHIKASQPKVDRFRNSIQKRRSSLKTRLD